MLRHQYLNGREKGAIRNLKLPNNCGGKMLTMNNQQKKEKHFAIHESERSICCGTRSDVAGHVMNQGDCSILINYKPQT